MTEGPNNRLGQYELVEPIGRGGMAKVYRARQSHPIKREVAIKLISVNTAHIEEAVTRFRREAQIAAEVEHLNIVPIYDFGQQGGTFFLVMRLIEGGNLDKRLRESGPLSLKETGHIFGQVGAALHFAHEHGVLHRDLKPGNILLDKEGNAYLTDFGIARLVDQTHMTRTGMLTGTPTYMAPELWRTESATRQSDIYAMGAILYEMLTGDPPFKVDDPVALPYLHLNAPPPDPRDLNAALPEGITTIVHKALSKDPVNRYQTIEEMLGDLNTVITGPILAEKKPEFLPLQARLPILVGGLAVLLIGLIVLITQTQTTTSLDFGTIKPQAWPDPRDITGTPTCVPASTSAQAIVIPRLRVILRARPDNMAPMVRPTHICEQLEAIGKLGSEDSLWYLVRIENNATAWLWWQGVDLSPKNAPVPVVTLTPSS